mgnify:CR=1 FL=1
MDELDCITLPDLECAVRVTRQDLFVEFYNDHAGVQLERLEQSVDGLPGLDVAVLAVHSHLNRIGGAHVSSS